MMQAGIDGRDRQPVMQTYITLPQQVTAHPGDHQRTNHLREADTDGIAVELEEPRIQPKQQDQRQIGKDHLVHDIHRMHIRKERLL